MRRMKLLGLALLALFAFGVVVAATASAEEKEPAGLLYLPGEEGPVTVKGEGIKAEPSLTTTAGKITCTTDKIEGEIGKGEGKHSTLGTLTVDYTGCKETKKLGCRSENIMGEKDPAETILQQAIDTDIHLVSEEREGKLLPGILVGLLELKEKEKSLDLTINCGGVKILVLGATLLEVKGVNLGASEVTTVEVTPPTLKHTCDKNDELCKKELASWGVTVGGVVCPLAASFGGAEECAEFSAVKATPVTISKDVLIDF